MKHEHDREEIIAANPLLDYCQARGWEVKRDGPRWKCLCPLHNEKTPSFTITPEKNLWKCFGCDEGGSVIDLHSKLKGISIGEAMRDLSPGRGVRSGNGSVSPSASANSLLLRKRNLSSLKRSRYERLSPMITMMRPGRSSIRWCATSPRRSSNARLLTGSGFGTWRASSDCLTGYPSCSQIRSRFGSSKAKRMSRPCGKQWNSVQCACFVRHSLAGRNPANRLLQIRSSIYRNR